MRTINKSNDAGHIEGYLERIDLWHERNYNGLSQSVTMKPTHCYDILKFLSAEEQLNKCMPEWIRITSSLKLKAVLQQYLDVVHKHIKTIGLFITEKKLSSPVYQNRIMDAFIEATEKKILGCTNNRSIDECLAKCCEAISFYKKSSYALAAAFTEGMGKEKETIALTQAQMDEEQMNKDLTEVIKYMYQQNVQIIHPI